MKNLPPRSPNWQGMRDVREFDLRHPDGHTFRVGAAARRAMAPTRVRRMMRLPSHIDETSATMRQEVFLRRA